MGGWVFVCVPVTFCWFMWVLCYFCIACIYYIFMYNSVCLHMHSWPHQVMIHMDLISGVQTEPALSQLFMYAYGHPNTCRSHLTELKTQCNVETCNLLVLALQSLFFSRLERQRRLLVPDDLWYLFCYLFSGSDAMQCMWVGQLSGGPSLGPHSCDQALHGVAFGLALWGPVWE